MPISKSLIIKTAMILFLAAYLILIYTSDNAKNISMDDIAGQMESSDTLTAMQKRDKGDLQRYYSIMDTDTDGFLFYKDVSPMSVNEMLIVKAKNKSDAEKFLEAAESHLESQENVFGAYGTDQMALLGDASVESRGDYVWYMCGPDASAWHDAFMKLI